MSEPRAVATAPDAGEFTEIAAGIIWIRLPIPGSLRHINVWLVPGRRGWFLVDTGMKTEQVRLAWESLEQTLPLRQELEAIVVTHHHPDHFGMARWLSERFGLGVAMTERAAAAASASLQDDPPDRPSRSEGFATRLGLSLDDETRAIMRGGMYRRIVSGAVEAEPLAAGASLGRGSDEWLVSIHEGHAPGHACLLKPSVGILISGDQLLPSISSNISLYPSNEQGDPLGDYFESLDQLAALDSGTLVLPAHGQPFRGPHARIDALRREHHRRLDQILDLCGTPAATERVAAGLFSIERLDPLNRLLAATETLAHLRFLELRGQVARMGEGAAMRWYRG